MGRPDWPRLWALFATALLVAHAGEACAALAAADVVFKGGTLVDGTGAAGRRADVAVRGDRIVAVGSFEAEPEARVIDASGLIVAPGFIDLHTHSDEGITRPPTRLNRNYLTQGVTTIVTGNCGGGALDVAKYFAAIDAHGAGTNVIHLVPHGAVRSAVMGNGGPGADAGRAGADEAPRRARAWRPGAWGMSTGLIYVPGRYAETAELIELAKVVARHGGIYASPHPQRGGRPARGRSTRPSRSARGPASRSTSRT